MEMKVSKMVYRAWIYTLELIERQEKLVRSTKTEIAKRRLSELRAEEVLLHSCLGNDETVLDEEDAEEFIKSDIKARKK